MTSDYKYVIGPGDTVNIVVWRNPELSLSVPVRPDGKITTPLVEDLDAMGKDPSSLARDIEKALEKFIRDPVVTVIVTAFVGPYTEQIRVIGEAAKPQVLAYKQKMTVSGRDDCCRRIDRFRRRQSSKDPASFRWQRTILSAAQRLGKAR
jgi:polysaccharide export outer membrane protein